MPQRLPLKLNTLTTVFTVVYNMYLKFSSRESQLKAFLDWLLSEEHKKRGSICTQISSQKNLQQLPELNGFFTFLISFRKECMYCIQSIDSFSLDNFSSEISFFWSEELYNILKSKFEKFVQVKKLRTAVMQVCTTNFEVTEFAKLKKSFD